LLPLLKLMPEASQIAENQRFETEWEELRLVVEERPDHWQAFVYDVANCEVLHPAEQPTADAARLAALEFAATHTCGSKHGLKLQVVVTMLIWEPAL
jgi:hypothetical protein